MTIGSLDKLCEEFKTEHSNLFKTDSRRSDNYINARSPLYRLELARECNGGVRYNCNDYTIHHINGNSSTYNIDNLVTMQDIWHKNYHNKLNYLYLCVIRDMKNIDKVINIITDLLNLEENNQYVPQEYLDNLKEIFMSWDKCKKTKMLFFNNEKFYKDFINILNNKKSKIKKTTLIKKLHQILQNYKTNLKNKVCYYDIMENNNNIFFAPEEIVLRSEQKQLEIIKNKFKNKTDKEVVQMSLNEINNTIDNIEHDITWKKEDLIKERNKTTIEKIHNDIDILKKYSQQLKKSKTVLEKTIKTQNKMDNEEINEKKKLEELKKLKEKDVPFIQNLLTIKQNMLTEEKTVKENLQIQEDIKTLTNWLQKTEDKIQKIENTENLTLQASIIRENNELLIDKYSQTIENSQKKCKDQEEYLKNISIFIDESINDFEKKCKQYSINL